MNGLDSKTIQKLKKIADEWGIEVTSVDAKGDMQRPRRDLGGRMNSFEWDKVQTLQSLAAKCGMEIVSTFDQDLQLFPKTVEPGSPEAIPEATVGYPNLVGRQADKCLVSGSVEELTGFLEGWQEACTYFTETLGVNRTKLEATRLRKFFHELTLATLTGKRVSPKCCGKKMRQLPYDNIYACNVCGNEYFGEDEK